MARPSKAPAVPPPTEMIEFAAALRAVVESLEMRQGALAKRMLVSPQEMSRWVLARDVPTAEQFSRLREFVEPDVFERLERLRAVAAGASKSAVAGVSPSAEETLPAVGTSTPADGISVSVKPAMVRRRRLEGLAGTVIVLVVVAFLPVAGKLTSMRMGAAAGDSSYWQCTDRKRSILTQPGKDRGGKLVGYLMPGEEFVVTGEVRYWTRGYHLAGSERQEGFVMGQYLFPDSCR